MEAAVPFLTVGEVARLLPGSKPQDISGLFYRRELPGADADCPLVGGRRMIPPSYVETIRLALSRAGKLPLPRREVADAR
jgi:hypothetical protein